MYLKMVRAVLEVLFQNREGGHTRQERQEQHERGNIQPGAQRHADYAATPKTDRRGQSLDLVLGAEQNRVPADCRRAENGGGGEQGPASRVPEI